MSDVWETKDGRRRVRRDPPTLDDAVLAAQGLADDVDGQIEIVMSLMQVSAEAARGAVLRMGDSARTPAVSPSPAGPARHAPWSSNAARRAGCRCCGLLQPAPGSGVGYNARRYQAVPDEKHDDRADDGADQTGALVGW